MRLEKLMVGDLVYCTYWPYKRIVKVSELKRVADDELKVVIELDGLHLVFGEQYIEPIPLTIKILDKNFKETLPGINLMYNLKGPYCVMNEESDQWVFGLIKEEGGASKRFPLVKIMYVHELQLALRLCGIEKSIEP